MKLTVLFWNFNIAKGKLMQKERGDAAKAAILARVARRHDVDLLVLCECRIHEDVILKALKDADTRYETPSNPHTLFQFFTRFPGHELDAWQADGRIAVRRFHRVGYIDVMLAAFHYIDAWNNSPERQHAELETYKQTIAEAEHKAGHSRFAIFGDFNMDPFSIGMTDPKNGLGAMMTWELAESHSEAKRGGRPRFFNPMWSVLGRAEAPGSYYWKQSEPRNAYWHCIDGVLLRPALRSIFVEDSVRILPRIPGPDGSEIPLYHQAEKHCQIDYSDHLPIVFQLDIPEDKEDCHAGVG